MLRFAFNNELDIISFVSVCLNCINFQNQLSIKFLNCTGKFNALQLKITNAGVIVVISCLSPVISYHHSRLL